MNKLCLFAKNKNSRFISRLTEELGNDVLTFDPWSDLVLPEASFYLVRTTGIYHSDLDLMFLKSLPAEKVVNPLPSLELFRNKPRQFLWMEENHFSILPWLSLKDQDLLTLEKFCFLYPHLVIKPHIGQGGWGVELIKKDELKSRFKKQDKDYLIQPYVRDASEYRYFFIKDQAPIVLKRSSKSGIAANFQKEGEAILSSLPQEFTAEIERLVKLSGALYGAVDLLVDQGKLWILEVNTVPGLEQLEQVSGENVAKRLTSLFGY